jgi:uncharacterized protein (TIGR00290 family)
MDIDKTSNLAAQTSNLKAKPSNLTAQTSRLKEKAYMNWSGGKDSALALHQVLSDPSYDVRCLLTNLNATHNRISMHGVRRELLEQQAIAIGLPLETVELPEQPGMADYETIMALKANELKQRGFTKAVFGDIFLEDLKKYREEKLAPLGITCRFPLWQHDTVSLMREFIALGFKAIVVCVNRQYLDESFCGRQLDEAFLNDLPAGVDPCGENGEYHSFVYDGPIFSRSVNFTRGKLITRRYPAPANTTTSDDRMDQPAHYDFYFRDLEL